MRLEEEDIYRAVRESRLEGAADMEQAALMLPSDTATLRAIDDYRRLSLEDDSHASEHCTLALERLERSASGLAMPPEFWVLLKQSAVREALYYHAQRYKKREDAA
jgi:hypothetical protein